MNLSLFRSPIALHLALHITPSILCFSLYLSLSVFSSSNLNALPLHRLFPFHLLSLIENNSTSSRLLQPFFFFEDSPHDSIFNNPPFLSKTLKPSFSLKLPFPMYLFFTLGFFFFKKFPFSMQS